MNTESYARALTIAGSDSGGGAGIQADLKSVHANGAYALTAITAVTAQNTVAVRDAFDLPVEIIRAQLDAVFEDFAVSAVKTGMLSSTAIVECVADSLAAGSAVGFGYQLMFQLDIIISIIAGSLVAVSAGLSIYINVMERRLKKKELEVNDESDS